MILETYEMAKAFFLAIERNSKRKATRKEKSLAKKIYKNFVKTGISNN